MPEVLPHLVLRQIIRDFEALASHIDSALEAYPDDDDSREARALKNARQAALRGAETARSGLSTNCG